MAVAASPKLWMRSASRATLPEATKTRSWATAVAPRTTSARPTARRPSRERLIESWDEAVGVAVTVLVVV